MVDIAAIKLEEIGRVGWVEPNPSYVTEIQKGFYLGKTNASLAGQALYQTEIFPFAAMTIMLQGNVSTVLPGMTEMDAQTVSIVSHNDRDMVTTQLQSSSNLQNVEIFITPEWFERFQGGSLEDPVLSRMREAMERPLHHKKAAANSNLQTIAKTLLQPVAGGAVAALRMEARALDLLAELAESFEEQKQSIGLSACERDLIIAVARSIEINPVVAINDVAVAFGLSASKLRRQFPLVFSISIGAFINDQRLQMAYRLIEAGMRVSQAAYRAGYAHPTNFATAFKRRFGVAPKSLHD